MPGALSSSAFYPLFFKISGRKISRLVAGSTGLTEVVSLALLLPWFVSAVSADTLALLVRLPAIVEVTTISTLVLPPSCNSPRLQVITPPTWDHEP